uniref:C-type lectin domain-containing protein n=1 Tax=Astatotilapia calliptera TaxID=8154 RepID=A0A3P8R2Y3_ASTCA
MFFGLLTPETTMSHSTGSFLMLLMTTTRMALVSTGSSKTVQFHFINESLTWYEAQSFCRLKYTDLATINNMDEENQLVSTLDSHKTTTWIGLYNGKNNRWLWSDGSGRADFTKWSLHQPDNYNGEESCAEIQDDGLWNDIPCDLTRAYVCYEIQQDGSKKYVVYTQGQTWQSSQDLCRQNHTDLACVLTDKENAAIAAVTTKAWIGLFKDAWVWSDGTKTSFRYWKRGGSYSGNCVSVEGSQTGRWIPADCNKKATFICQGDAKLKKMVIRMKVKSDVGLTDSAASSQLLMKLETILRDQGVADFKLSWQSDKNGSLFQR